MPPSYASTRLRRGAILVVVLATFCTSAAPQLPPWSSAVNKWGGQKLADKALTKYISVNQPIDYNYGELFPQVPQLSGTAFAPSLNAAQVSAESAQLAQSPNGEIALAPGDYAIPVRLYCTHIYTGTAPGLNYLLAQLNGKRAHVITMLTARVGYDRVPYQPVQVLSWAIQNGMTYAELTPVERSLVDRVIPDQRAALGDDFVEQVGAYWNDYAMGHRGLPDFETELQRLGPVGDQVLKYERAKNAMSQHPDDYDALRNEFILEGQAPAGLRRDPPWSQVRPEVLERLIPPEVGWIGGVGTLQIRVLPVSAPTTAVPITDIIGYPPNTMQPVTFSIVGASAGVPEQGGSRPLATGNREGGNPQAAFMAGENVAPAGIGGPYIADDFTYTFHSCAWAGTSTVLCSFTLINTIQERNWTYCQCVRLYTNGGLEAEPNSVTVAGEYLVNSAITAPEGVPLRLNVQFSVPKDTRNFTLFQWGQLFSIRDVPIVAP